MYQIFGKYRGYNKNLITELSDVCMIYRFSYVFPKELSGLPSDQEIEFEVESLPGIAPISKASY